MMLGFLLARAGVARVVLEKHADFLRDFRGDTVHPSTLRSDGRARPARRVPARAAPAVLELIGGWFGDQRVQLADFTRLPARCAFIALMPQWDFLDFLAGEARQLPDVHAAMRAEVTGLIEEGGRVVGVRGTDARRRRSRSAPTSSSAPTAATRPCAPRAGLAVEDLGAPIDVLWFRVARDPAEPDNQPGAASRPASFLVTIDRGDYWQCAFVIAKGGAEALQRAALEAFRAAGRRRPRRCWPRASREDLRAGTTSSCSPSPSIA